MGMHSSVTTRCSNCQHLEFRLDCESAVPQGDVDSLLSFLEGSVEKGARYEDGHLIAFGSMLLRVVTVDDVFILEEPDLDTLPIKWRVGVTESMKLLRMQRDIADGVGLVDKMDFPSIRTSLLIGVDVIHGSKRLVLDRITSSGSDSGWFVGHQESALDYNDHTNLNRISVYHAILSWPQIARFLALPAGCRVDVSEMSSVVTRGGVLLNIRKGSFLEVVNKLSGNV